MMMLNWLNERSFEIDGCKITLDYAHGGSTRASSDADFTMMKARNFFPHYLELANTGIRKVLELGIYQGGSVVFLDKLVKPEKLSAVDIMPPGISALDHYAERSNGRIKIYYGTSQDDAQKLHEIIANDFGGELDFVVDDASHFYEFSKASFATVFPYVKPGGLYYIEDWSWSFQQEFQEQTAPWFDRNSLANLAIDLMETMICSKAIESIDIVPEMIKVRRSQHAAADLFATRARRLRATSLL